MMYLFVLMTAYYIIKPIRESLILGGAGPELKSYAGAAGAVAFLLVVPLYGKIASRLNRIQLINSVTAFFALNLVMFYFSEQLTVSSGVVFFFWVGLFNLTLVSQCWAFANDIYTQEQGKRLFAIIGVGSSLGAIFGSQLAGHLFKPLGPYRMMLVASGMLFVCILLASWIHHRETRFIPTAKSHEALKPHGGFQLVFKQRYLLFIALLIVLSNVVNTTGEFMLSKSVAEHARAATVGHGVTMQEYIGTFYAHFYFWANLLGAAFQLFAVSRIMKWVGIGPALFFLPMIALSGYALLSFVPLLSYIRLTKIAENGTDYSIQNTARHALFLRTDRESKYKGKTAIDGFFWRVGDALSALLVFVGTSFAFGVRDFARTNAVLTALWLCVVAAIVWRRVYDREPEPDKPETSCG